MYVGILSFMNQPELYFFSEVAVIFSIDNSEFLVINIYLSLGPLPTKFLVLPTVDINLNLIVFNIIATKYRTK